MDFFFLVLGDQITKFLFDIKVINSGIARGISIPRYISIGVGIFVLGLIYHYGTLLSKREKTFLVAGIIGNMIDRMMLQGVRDWLWIPGGRYINLADMYLTIGTGIYLYRMFFNEKKNPDFKKLFSQLKPQNNIDLAKKLIGKKMFRRYRAVVNGKLINAVEGGKLSCAYFVSNILKYFDEIKTGHVTVTSTITDMLEQGRTRYPIDDEKEIPRGAVLVREEIIDVDKQKHQHIGFYIGNHQAISNNSNTRTIQQHHFTYNGNRKIENYYTYEREESNNIQVTNKNKNKNKNKKGKKVES